MLSDNLSKIRDKALGKDKETVTSEFYILAKELGCLGDLIGREYEFIFSEGKIVGFRQKPIPIPTFVTLMNELVADYKRQEKASKKRKR